MADGFERYPFPLHDAARAVGPFRYINQTVMTKAVAPTVDSWVHLAQTRRPPIIGTAVFVLAAPAAASAAVYAGLQAFGAVPIANENTSNSGLFLGMLAMAAIAVVSGWIAWLLVGRVVRNGSFGARPSGVAFGEHGVIVRVPGRDIEIPWTTIRSITASVQNFGDRKSTEVPLIHLALDPNAPITERAQLITANGYVVSGHAVYTALRWYHAHPEARWELGRIEGERRLESWRQFALQPVPR